MGATSRKGESVELHSGHAGITRMKGLMRGLVWWPGIDADVEKLVKECSPCQQTQPSPPLAPLNHHSATPQYTSLLRVELVSSTPKGF